MTHRVYNVLYAPDINHLVPVGSSGRPSHTETLQIPSGAALAPPLFFIFYPPACPIREAKLVGSKQRDFPVAQGKKKKNEQ